MEYSNQNHLKNNNNVDEFPSYQNSKYEDFKKIGKKIGSGQFSKVYKCKNIKTGDIYAMKIIEKLPEGQLELQEKQVRREIQNLFRCYHWEKNYNTLKLFNFFETEEEFILILNYCDTNLEKLVNEKYKDKKMPLEDIKLLFLELNNGFRNLYEENVIHRDIKINNILIEYRFGDPNDYIPRLGDFGISRENFSDINNPMTLNISWFYLTAPEVLKNGRDYSFASDLWSIGTLLYKLAFGKYPFEGNDMVKLTEIVTKGPYRLEKSGDHNFDDLISKLLNKDKNKRINYEDYFNHPFFKYDEPFNLINFNNKYNMDISSYKREVRTEKKDGNILLKDLSDIEFVRLKELNLQNCNISDLTPLTSSTFKDLIFLNLQYNNIYNLNPMKDIKFLGVKEIYLGVNSITDISPLEKIQFKCLTSLGLSGNKIIWDENTKRIYNSIIKK